MRRAAVLLCLLLAGTACGGDDGAEVGPTAAVTLGADDVTCEHDITSLPAKSTVEKLGGRVAEDYVVRFVRSTRAGVVALVEGDVQAAYDDAAGLPELGVVAGLEPGRDPGSTITGFAQVGELVEALCPA